MRWTDALDERLKELFERGYNDAGIADALSTDTGTTITRDAVKNRAVRIGLEKDHDNGPIALFTKPRSYNHLKLNRLKDGARVLVAFNDMQIPFQDDPTIKCLLRFTQDFEPTHVIAAGDGLDFYEMSQFDKNPSRQFRFKDELQIAHRIIKDIERVTPKADRYWIDGNHEDRLRRWLWRHGAAIAGLPSLEPQALMHLENWTHLTYGSSVTVMGVVIEHGDGGGTNLGSRMFARRGTSGICGHSHRFHDLHITNAGGVHRYIENGCLCTMKPEFVARPNWQWGFTYGIVKNGRLDLYPTLITPDGFRAEGSYYKRTE